MSEATAEKEVLMTKDHVQKGDFCRLSNEVNNRDAGAILATLQAAASVWDDYSAQASRQIREAVTHYWQMPRVPAGHWAAGQYPEALRWSPVAAELWEDETKFRRVRTGARHPVGGVKLTLEHVFPMGILTAELLENLDSFTAPSLAEFLIEHHKKAPLVVMTRDEDAILTKAGLKSSTPDKEQPHLRYEVLGYFPDDLKPVNPGVCICA